MTAIGWREARRREASRRAGRRRPRGHLSERQVDTIRDYLRCEPFEPFVIRMSNGEVHEVRHPECAFVMTTKMIVCYPDDDRSVTCALVHVNSIAALQAS